MIKILLWAAFLSITIPALSQSRYFTKSGRILFESEKELENIEAENKSVTAVLEPASGKLQFSVIIRGFEFHKALMQQHFNESYMESRKFPKANFSGIISGSTPVASLTAGIHEVKASGELTIHGVTKTVEIPGTISVEDGILMLSSEFDVVVADYNIQIPAVVRNKIAKTVRVKVNCRLEPLKR